MSALPDHIQALSDTEAPRILTTFARHQPGYTERQLTAELSQALHNEPTLSAAEATTAGELARTALLLLADDPNQSKVLEALVSGPPAQQFGLVVELATVVSAVLFVLGTHLKVERDKAGQWTFKIEKKPTDNALLKGLLEKLLGLAGKRGGSDPP